MAIADTPQLLTDLRQLIEQSRQAAAAAVNAGLLMYWHIGQRTRTEVLTGQRANYGEEIVSTASRQLTDDYRRNFKTEIMCSQVSLLRHYPNASIVSAQCAQSTKSPAPDEWILPSRASRNCKPIISINLFQILDSY